MNVKPLVAFSLILNLGLLGAVGWLAKSRPAGSKANPAVFPQATPSLSQAAQITLRSKTNASPPAVAEGSKPAQSFDWRMVESEDYKKYIANLRAIGCPEETIRDIIT